MSAGTAHAEGEIYINRPVGEVFGFVADGLNNPKWRPDVVTINRVVGTAKTVGAIYRQAMKGLAGRRVRADYQVTEFQPGQRLAYRVIAGMVRPVGRYIFEPVQSGTRVRFRLDWHPTGMQKLIAPLASAQFPAEIASLGRLKEILERSHLDDQVRPKKL